MQTHEGGKHFFKQLGIREANHKHTERAIEPKSELRGTFQNTTGSHETTSPQRDNAEDYDCNMKKKRLSCRHE